MIVSGRGIHRDIGNGPLPRPERAIWDWEHEKMMDETADVKRLLEMYKG